MSIAERSVSGQEIIVPPNLPLILKEFCKAAIRTQPYDLLKWSSSYFRALADGEEPPIKLRLEYPPPSTASGLTLGFLRILLRQFGDYNKSLPVETILRRWDCLCLDRRDFNLILMIGKFRRKCQVKKFLAIAVGLLSSSLFETMILICELFTHEPEGGSAMVPVTFFMEIYGYLAGLRCDGSERDPTDEDPTEFIVYEPEPFIHQEINEEKSSVDRVCSVASQDTEADVNLDLELVSKGDTESSRKCSKKSERIDEKRSSEDGNGSADSSSNKQIVRSTEDKVLSERRRKKKVIDPKLLKYYPNVPGIGPRLSAEEVASVAIWLSECARVQEGMVGPRNLRHMNCPPIDRQQLSDS
ncbi:Ropporin-1-like protein [Habropoda laboriosa]|uniref:Ropporin-1-like protein n=1 Tax=Habropoda laboriosa TaxID=597456 RepID=A0A0L7R9Z3_9HYME|nr:Ropporin-1-like protein [Habropoda laboriosa]